MSSGFPHSARPAPPVAGDMHRADQLAGGMWECTASLFSSFLRRLVGIGPAGAAHGCHHSR